MSISPQEKSRKEEVVIAPEFAKRVQEKLDEKKLNMRQLAAKLHRQYDTIRKACKGVAFAGNSILPGICAELGLDLTEMEELITDEKHAHKGYFRGEDFVDRLLMDISDIFSELPRSDKKEILDDIRRRHEAHRGKSSN